MRTPTAYTERCSSGCNFHLGKEVGGVVESGLLPDVEERTVLNRCGQDHQPRVWSRWPCDFPPIGTAVGCAVPGAHKAIALLLKRTAEVHAGVHQRPRPPLHLIHQRLAAKEIDDLA